MLAQTDPHPRRTYLEAHGVNVDTVLLRLKAETEIYNYDHVGELLQFPYNSACERPDSSISVPNVGANSLDVLEREVLERLCYHYGLYQDRIFPADNVMVQALKVVVKFPSRESYEQDQKLCHMLDMGSGNMDYEDVLNRIDNVRRVMEERFEQSERVMEEGFEQSERVMEEGFEQARRERADVTEIRADVTELNRISTRNLARYDETVRAENARLRQQLGARLDDQNAIITQMPNEILIRAKNYINSVNDNLSILWIPARNLPHNLPLSINDLFNETESRINRIHTAYYPNEAGRSIASKIQFIISYLGFPPDRSYTPPGSAT